MTHMFKLFVEAVLGVGLVVTGIAAVSVPAALVVAGVAVIVAVEVRG